MPIETLKVTKDIHALLVAVGKRLRAIREEREESIDEVAAWLRTTPARIRRAEAGHPGVALGMYAMLLRRYDLQHQLRALGAVDESDLRRAIETVETGLDNLESDMTPEGKARLILLTYRQALKERGHGRG